MSAFAGARTDARHVTATAPQTRAAHRSWMPVCAAEGWTTERNALELSGCPRLRAAGGGADGRVQDQQQLERPALAARAAGLAQAVNIVADEHCCRWLLDGALRLCSAAAHALQHSLTAQAGPTRPSQAGRAVPAACA